jgi:hypothetical protein
MGAGNDFTSGKTTFFNFFEGKFTQKCEKEAEGAVSRTNKNNDVVWEYHYNKLSGIITKIDTHEHEQYGKSWLFTLSDNEGNYVLKLPYSGSATNSILLRLENLDLSKEVTLIGYYFEKDKKSRIGVSQEGKKIEPKYTKENPGALPPLVPVVFKGKDTLDDTEQMRYLEKMVFSTIVPKLGKTKSGSGNSSQSVAENDLPF